MEKPMRPVTGWMEMDVGVVRSSMNWTSLVSVVSTLIVVLGFVGWLTRLRPLVYPYLIVAIVILCACSLLLVLVLLSISRNKTYRTKGKLAISRDGIDFDRGAARRGPVLGRTSRSTRIDWRAVDIFDAEDRIEFRVSERVAYVVPRSSFESATEGASFLETARISAEAALANPPASIADGLAVTFALTPEESKARGRVILRWFGRRVLWRTRFGWLIILPIFAAAIIGITWRINLMFGSAPPRSITTVFANHWTAFLPMLIGLLPVLIALLGSTLKPSQDRNTDALNRILCEERTILLEPDGVCVNGSMARRISWKQVDKAIIDDRFVHFIASEFPTMSIPMRAFTDFGQCEHFVDVANAYAAAAKAGTPPVMPERVNTWPSVWNDPRT